MTINLDETLSRVVALQIEALAALAPAVVADSKPYYFHQQESFPYFTNRVGDLEVDQDSDEIDLYNYQVVMRLVIGHKTSDYNGENEKKIRLWVPQLVNYFNRRSMLQSATYPVAQDFLVQARISGSFGFRVFQNTGVGVDQIGTELTMICEFEEQIDQVYV